MPELDSSPLWRISDFERLRQTRALAGLERQTLLSSTLHAELSAMERRRHSADPLEIFAMCLRLNEPALIYFQCDEVVWPVTLFPVQRVYHSPRSLTQSSPHSLTQLRTLLVEPPGVRPPGHPMHERVARAQSYHPLTPALWHLGLHGPRATLLAPIGGKAAYRVVRNPLREDLDTPGALASAVQRLRNGPAALRHIASWPGMDTERAIRLLNALYLTSNLMISRSGPAARSEPGQGLFRRISR